MELGKRKREEYTYLAEDFCFHRLFGERDNTADVTVVFQDDSRAPVHSHVLRCRWRTFKDRWTKDCRFREDSNKQVSLAHVNPEIARAFVAYTYCYPMYCEEHLKETTEVPKITEIASLAHKMGFRSLLLDLVKCLRNYLDIDSGDRDEPFGNSRPGRRTRDPETPMKEQESEAVSWMLSQWPLFWELEDDDEILSDALSQLRTQVALFLSNNTQSWGTAGRLRLIRGSLMYEILKQETSDVEEPEMLQFLLQWLRANCPLDANGELDPPDDILGLFDLIHWTQLDNPMLVWTYNFSQKTTKVSLKFRAYLTELILETCFAQEKKAKKKTEEFEGPPEKPSPRRGHLIPRHPHVHERTHARQRAPKRTIVTSPSEPH